MAIVPEHKTMRQPDTTNNPDGIVKLTPLEMTLDNIRRVESLPGPALLSSSLTWAAGNC